MAFWAVGDVHGMIEPLLRLETKLGWRSGRDRVVLLGDLVGRGRHGLEVLRWAQQRREWVEVLLGNHDFALLMSAIGARAGKPELLDILAAPDAEQLIDWLRGCRMLIEHEDWLLVHAGILPVWSRARLCEHAAAVEAALRGRHWRQALAESWGNDQLADDPAASADAQLQLAVNALSRMRWCNRDGSICLNPRDAKDSEVIAWYAHPQRPAFPVVCGHWSQHGLCLRADLAMIDCGCVYGQPLAAWNLDERTIAFA